VSNLLYIIYIINIYIYTYVSALLNPTAACCSNTSQYQETPPAESIFFWQTAASRLLGFWTFRYRNGFGSTFNSTERTMCLITHLSVWFILASFSFFGRYPNSNYIFKCGVVGKCFQHLMVKTVLFFCVAGGVNSGRCPPMLGWVLRASNERRCAQLALQVDNLDCCQNGRYMKIHKHQLVGCPS